jgi:hypothetical protein
VLFDAARPVILNGIEDIVTRPNLADRAVFLTLEPIPEERRRQVVLWVKDELTTAIDARMPGDLARAADDRNLVDEALCRETIGGERRIIVHAIAHHRGRGDLRRALVAGLEGQLGQSPQHRLIRDKPFANCLLCRFDYLYASQQVRRGGYLCVGLWLVWFGTLHKPCEHKQTNQWSPSFNDPFQNAN